MLRCRSAAILVAIAAAAFPPSSHAQSGAPPAENTGWYLGAEAGWTDLGSEEARLPGAKDGQAWSDGIAAGVRAGYRLGPVRIEEEFRYGTNDLDRIGLHPARGSRDAYAFMTNGIYDIDLGQPITPHIGAGIGAVGLHDGARVPSLGIASFDNSSDWVFGYQAIAGISYRLSPSLSVDLDYRYLATTQPHFTTSPGLVIDGVARGGEPLSSGYAIQSILASVRWNLGQLP